MLPFHRRLAETGLAAVAEFGFALAGGYAISVNGMGDRPSNDVDMFTNLPDPGRFAVAVDRLMEAYTVAGLQVESDVRGPTFADLHVTDPVSGESASVQLGLDWRAYPPAELEIGPVLDQQDAVGGKMSALWSRGEARDYIDIDTVVESGRFSRDEVIVIADRVESRPVERRMLAERFREAGRHSERVYAAYGVDPKRRSRIITSFAAWADEIDPGPTEEGSLAASQTQSSVLMT
ncbi:MAG: nucleotidyl transferase AbiEii/AbiGii toxin family protein [Propionibacteriaceae bacterium]|nr:nucleotidyl transferase AbiEii/AbiGii toxin family protein [Propionibacteriaceae bacterium]